MADRPKAEALRMTDQIGPFARNTVVEGDAFELVEDLPPQSLDVIVTSPPYWGQRLSDGFGNEEDPRVYVRQLVELFKKLQPSLKDEAVVWINLGDAYNTPVNWRVEDRQYSSLGPEQNGLASDNSAYIKPRARRRAFVSRDEPWLQYGNLLALTYRLITSLCDEGYLYRGEVVWRKRNAMPEGRCRRPHRQHEPIYLLSVSERHAFRTSPPVPSVWEFPSEKVQGLAHYSRFPEELPRRCIEAYGRIGSDVVVLDPFSGSGTTGVAALKLGCAYLGFEIDGPQVAASNDRLRDLAPEPESLFG